MVGRRSQRSRDIAAWTRCCYHLGLNEQALMGVFRLQECDPDFWPEMPDGDALYLHKLAVYPAHQGQGWAHALLAHAATLARARGRSLLRLDCAGGRPKLCAVYERVGFRHHSQQRVGNGVFERFELDVTAFAF